MKELDKGEKLALSGINGKIVSHLSLSYDLKIKSLYENKEYRQCLKEILSSTEKIRDENNYIRGLCCLLLDTNENANTISDLKSKIKREGYRNLIYAFDYLEGGNKYTGDINILTRFAETLIDSSDGDAIKYIRMILENSKDLSYVEIAKKAYERGMYYLSEEIITLYCKDKRYDYDNLLILINIYLNTGKLGECQRYIALARVMNDSLELGKLDCLCKIKECESIILGFKEEQEFDSLEEVFNHLKESEKILSK